MNIYTYSIRNWAFKAILVSSPEHVKSYSKLTRSEKYQVRRIRNVSGTLCNKSEINLNGKINESGFGTSLGNDTIKGKRTEACRHGEEKRGFDIKRLVIFFPVTGMGTSRKKVQRERELLYEFRERCKV